MILPYMVIMVMGDCWECLTLVYIDYEAIYRRLIQI